MTNAPIRLHFAWIERFGRLEPICRTDGPGPLANLLVDDGGQRYLDTIPWLDEGLRLTARVKGGGAEAAIWGREAWAAALTRHEAKIYSTYDDTCFQVVGLDSFEHILTAWRRFIQSTPDAARSEAIDVPA